MSNIEDINRLMDMFTTVSRTNLSRLTLDSKACKLLKEYIEKLEKENEELKNDYKNLQDSYIVRNKLLEDSTPNSKIRTKIKHIEKWNTDSVETERAKAYTILNLQELLEENSTEKH